VKPVIKVEIAIDQIIPILEVFLETLAPARLSVATLACTWISDDILAIIVGSG
jgi:hypothetical protein